MTLSTFPDNHVPLIIDNQDVVSPSAQHIPTTSPTKNKIIYQASSIHSSQVASVVRSSTIALQDWRNTAPTYRRDLLLRAAQILENRSEECADAMESETAASRPFGLFNVKTSVSMLRDIASRIVSAMNGYAPLCEDKNRQCMIIKEPVGVVLSIAPWNAPFVLGIRAVASAIAGGNTTILKGSELSPRCFWIIGDVLREAEFPKGVCNVIYASSEEAKKITETMIKAPEIRKISFTGSTAIGAAIAEMAGRALKPCLLELGGKASAIICEDADIDSAARLCTQGAFMHQGQICMSTEKVLVHTSILEPFIKRVKAIARETYPTDSETPPLAQRSGIEKNKTLVQEALHQGAQLVFGSHPSTSLGNPYVLGPLILSNVDPRMSIFHTETFAPIFIIMAYNTESEALTLANNSAYGLNAAVFSKDIHRAMRLARGIEAGNVHINGMTVHDEPNLPHGGVKSSGWGRFNGERGIQEFLVEKTVTWME